MTNLPRMYDFSKFGLKLNKADADTLKKYIQTDLKMTCSQLANVAIVTDIAR